MSPSRNWPRLHKLLHTGGLSSGTAEHTHAHMPACRPWALPGGHHTGAHTCLCQHQPPYTLTSTATHQTPHLQPLYTLLLSVCLSVRHCCMHIPILQSHPAPSYGNLPPHMYAAHSSAASAMTAQVAASSQQHRAAGASSPNSQKSISGSSSGRQEKADVYKLEDFVEVEKSNMVMLVSVSL